jgi:ADP-ribosylglycohydrolase
VPGTFWAAQTGENMKAEDCILGAFAGDIIGSAYESG